MNENQPSNTNNPAVPNDFGMHGTDISDLFILDDDEFESPEEVNGFIQTFTDIKKCAIIGLGLMGGSFALALAKYRPDIELFLYDTDDTVTASAVHKSGGETYTPDVLPEMDLVVLAAYLPAVISFLEDNASKFKKKSIVTDFAGLKRPVCSVGYALASKYRFTFLGGHPMCGKAAGGFENASSHLFQDKIFILCPEWNGFEGYDLFKEILMDIGISKLTETTPEEHDQMIAYTSQLPHIISASFKNSEFLEKADGFCADSFKDMIRVADMNPKLWTPVFKENSDFLAIALDDMINNLEKFRRLITRSTARELYNFIDNKGPSY